MLTVSTLILLSWVASALVAIGAIGSKIFDDYSRSALKRYCRQKGRVEFFNLVRDRYQNISLASGPVRLALRNTFGPIHVTQCGLGPHK